MQSSGWSRVQRKVEEQAARWQMNSHTARAWHAGPARVSMAHEIMAVDMYIQRHSERNGSSAPLTASLIGTVKCSG